MVVYVVGAAVPAVRGVKVATEAAMVEAWPAVAAYEGRRVSME